MTSYMETARMALALYRKGKTAIEIRKALGFPYAKSANHAVNVAIREEKYRESRLSPDELELIINVGRAELRLIERGDTCGPKLKYCGGWRWPKGKAERIARRRLNAERKGEDSRSATGLRLLYSYHGGYVFLTRAGWALFHAIEAERQKGGAA